MNRIILFILYVTFSFLCCSRNINNYEVKEKTKDSHEIISGKSQLEQIKTEQPESKRIHKWIEYKKVSPVHFEDTLPYNNCFIIIERDNYKYFRERELLENRTMVKDGDNHVFSFKEKIDDYIFFSTNYDTISLFRDRYDGLREYFLLDEIYYQNKQKSL